MYPLVKGFILLPYSTLSWRTPLSYRNQSTGLLRKSMDWFLYDNGLRHERVKEFGVIGTHSKIYELISDSNKKILINSTVNEIKQFFQCLFQKLWSSFQHHWISKRYKLPIGTRFIIASKQCVIKPLSKNITTAFKLLYISVQKYYDKSNFWYGINSFWLIHNNKPVIDIFNKLSSRRVADSVTTNGFSTLYTNISHGILIKALNFVTDFAFKGKTQSKLSVSNNDMANWSKTSKYF